MRCCARRATSLEADGIRETPRLVRWSEKLVSPAAGATPVVVSSLHLLANWGKYPVFLRRRMVATDAAIFGVSRRAGYRGFAAILVLLGILRAHAGELAGFEGGLRSTSSGSTSYTWGLEYREPLSGHFSAGFTWLNE